MRSAADRHLLICLSVGLLLRVLFVLAGFPVLEERWGLRDDGDGYQHLALSIRQGNYTDVTRGPVYPLFVAALGSATAVKMGQVLLDAMVVAMVFWLSRGSLAAAWLYAVYPFAIWRVAFINKEIVLGFLLAGYVCLQIRAWRGDKMATWTGAGVVLGLVNLCRPVFLAWPVALFLLGPRGHKMLVAIVAMVLVMAPWTARNYRVTRGEILPVATERGGVTTFIGNYQPTMGQWEGAGKSNWMSAVEQIQAANIGLSEVAMDRVFYYETWRHVLAQPVKALELIARKCGRFWFLSAARREVAASVAVQGFFLVALLIAIWRMRPWDREVVLMLSVILYVMIAHALSYADLRFSLPVMPLVCALIGRGISVPASRKSES
jgi:hypothetical protein